MKPVTPKTGTCLSLVLGLIVLAGFCSAVRPALALLDCPLPAGVTPPEDPRVTAQQVEDGSVSLTDFALAARDQFVSESAGITTVEQAAYVGCLVRQEGSAWRSGSTYLVQLTLDGRVLVHTQDMSLSGEKLMTLIYLAILQALGINPAVLADPGRAPAAFAAATMGDGGLFDVAGVAGATGYATIYFSASLRQPIVLLAGFDLGRSHLEEAVIDHLQPPVTASDVVDRTTLKDFVTEAGNYFIQLMESGDLAASSKARIALRDPNGPWRHGPVYVAILQLESRLILFHGAFPDRFELRRGGISRDIVTGELIVEQLIAAAESGPEGGFWLYYFDNPADDTDSAEIPKVGYARVFAADLTLPDGSTVPSRFIVNSGFYLSDDSEFVMDILEALEEGQTSILFGMTTPEDGDVVAGDAVAVSVAGASTDTVHFAYRLAGLPEEGFTYAGAAASREGVASFDWDTLDLPDDDYEFAALYTEDEGESVIYDAIEVSVDNVPGGGGGCAALPVPPGGGGPLDPTLTVLVGLLTIYLTLGRRRPMRPATLG